MLYLLEDRQAASGAHVLFVSSMPLDSSQFGMFLAYFIHVGEIVKVNLYVIRFYL